MIHLVDTIGVHSGAHYYDLEFRRLVVEAGGALTVVSNFEAEGARRVFLNFYRGGRLGKIARLTLSYARWLHYLIARGRSGWVVYQSFGLRAIDVLFTLPLILRGRFILDIHDLYSVQGTRQNRRLANFYYRHFVRRAIVHSERAREELAATGFRGELMQCPHFHYGFDTAYDPGSIPEETRRAVREGAVNLLFFGVIRESKRLDLFIEALGKIRSELAGRLNAVVAGIDKGGILRRLGLPKGVSVAAIDRRIGDEEMKFLFDRCDLAVMPYEEIYQSGVLEASIHMRLPVLCSDQVAFRETLGRHPSFGRIYSPQSADSLALAIEKAVGDLQSGKWVSFDKAELDHYRKDESLQRFIVAFIQGTLNDSVKRFGR